MKARVGAYLIRPGDLNPGWLPLYAATWALQWFCAALSLLRRRRGLVIVNWIARLEPAGPLPWRWPSASARWSISLATLVLPLGGWWFSSAKGAAGPPSASGRPSRPPSTQLRAADPKLRPPQRWFVIDDPEPNACAYADTLMVTRGTARQPLLPAVLAHELGHLNSSDGAGHRRRLPDHHAARNPLERPFRPLAWLVSGRIGDGADADALGDVLAPQGGAGRRVRGQARAGAALAAYLDAHGLDGDLPTPFKAFGESSHPWTEHRIEGLRSASTRQLTRGGNPSRSPLRGGPAGWG